MHPGISPELRPFQEETVRSRLRKEFYPFTNNQLKELLQQYDMYIQLLYQVLLFDEAQNGNKGPGTGAAACQGKKSAAATSFKTMLDLKQQKTPSQQLARHEQTPHNQTTQSSLKQQTTTGQSLSKSAGVQL